MIKLLFCLCVIINIPLYGCINGDIYYNNKYFKHFAILMRDSTDSCGNRIPFYPANNIISSDITIYDKLYDFYSVTIEDVVTCEKKIQNNEIINVNGFNNCAFRYKRKYIRLYCGFIDEKGIKYAIIRFVTKKEYKKRKYIYSNNIFNIAGDKKMRFVTIRI